MTFYKDIESKRWLSSCDMTFYQNQLNFATFCASSGCGIYYGDHLLSNKIQKVAQSFFRFHVYYQTRKILNELGCSLRGDPAFNEVIMPLI